MRTSSKRAQRFWLLAAIAASVLLYVPALGYSFVFDDWSQLVNNPRVRTWSALPGYFTEHVWAHALPPHYANYYRPVFLLWLRLTYLLFGESALGHHAGAIALHAVATALVFALARRLAPAAGPLVPGSAALLFALHATHVEAVAWVSGATETLFVSGALAAGVAFLRYRATPSPGNLALLALAAAGTLLAKEQGVIIVVVFALWQLLLPAGDGPRVAGWRAVLLTALLTALYLPLRYHMLQGWSHAPVHGTAADLLRTIPAVLTFYLARLVAPVAPPLSAFYGLGLIREFDVLFWLGLLGALCLGTVLWVVARGSRALACAVVLVLVPLAPPLLNLRLFISRDLVHDRYLMLATAGGAVAAALLLARAWTRAPRPAALAVLLIGTAHGLLALAAEPQWRDNQTLYTHAVRRQSGSSFARVLLGSELVARREPELAAAQFRAALAQDPEASRAYFLLGDLLFRAGRCADATPLLSRGLALDGRNGGALWELAVCQFRAGANADAEASLRRLLTLSPQALGVHHLLGDVYARAGQTDRARRSYREELARDPKNEDVRRKLSALP